MVHKGAVVEVDRLLSVDDYWNAQPNEKNSWFISALSHAKQFIRSHQTHRIANGDMEEVYDTELEPRNFLEQLGLRAWGEVTPMLRRAAESRGGLNCERQD